MEHNEIIEEDLEWSEHELQYSSLGDKRLDDRFKQVLKDLGSSPNSSIPACCHGWSETLAAYRFFQNKKVSSEQVLSSHRQSTIERMKRCDVVLLAQDSSNLCYTSKKEKINGLGYMDSETDYGMMLHPTVAFSPEGLCLGVTTIQTVVRDVANFGKAKRGSRASKPIEEKESYRWLEGYREASNLSKELPSTQVIMVGDREADIYDIYEEASTSEADWIVRIQHNRSSKEEENKDLKLFDIPSKSKSLTTLELNLPQTPKRKARKAKLKIYAKEVELKPPERRGSCLSSQVVNIVIAQEENPPRGVKPIIWRLVTNLKINSLENVIKVIEYYRGRWGIECFFRVLKTGCEIEELQLEHYDHLLPCIALYSIIAWRVMYLTHLGRVCPELPCSVVFLDEEWKAACIVATRRMPPEDPPTLYQMICTIASFGGYLNRKSDPPPGNQALWIGIQRNKDFTLGQMALRKAQTYV